MSNPDRIYLQPECCVDPSLGRAWSEDPAPYSCELGNEWVAYVRRESSAPPTCSAAHVRRLQEQNRLLAECLADERKLRKEAYRWYRDRLNSRFFVWLDLFSLVRR